MKVTTRRATTAGTALPATDERSHRTIVIERPRGWSVAPLRDLVGYRDLLYFLAWRDMKVRYTQAVMGVAWAVLQPLCLMAVFSVFLGRLAKVPSAAGIPYPVFAFSGLVPYSFFANAVSTSTESLVTNSKLVSKVYFPRVVVPLGALLSWVPDLVIALSLVSILMLVYGIVPAWTVVFLPLVIAFAMLAASSIGVWLSALNVAYRDVRYATPFLLQLSLFASPIVYPVTLVPEGFRLLYSVNPLVGVVEATRWALIGDGPPPWSLMAVSAAVALLLLWGGLYYFRRVESFFADLI